MNAFYLQCCHSLSFLRFGKLITGSKHTLEDAMNLKNCTVSWDLNSTYLSKVAFWKYKSRKPSHHGITTNKTTSTALFVNSNLLYNKSQMTLMQIIVNKHHGMAMVIMIQILISICNQILLSVLCKRRESLRSTKISSRIILFLH